VLSKEGQFVLNFKTSRSFDKQVFFSKSNVFVVLSAANKKPQSQKKQGMMPIFHWLSLLLIIFVRLQAHLRLLQEKQSKIEGMFLSENSVMCLLSKKLFRRTNDTYRDISRATCSTSASTCSPTTYATTTCSTTTRSTSTKARRDSPNTRTSKLQFFDFQIQGFNFIH